MINRSHRPHIRRLIIVLAAVLAIAALAVGAEPQPDGAKPPGLYDIDASGTDVRMVLETLAKCSGANIVVGSDITGDITAHLKQLPLESILDNLSTVSGFSWRKSGDAYLVASKDKLVIPDPPKPEAVAPAQQMLLVWQCKHIKPADVVTTIKTLYPKINVVEGPGSSAPVLPSSTGYSTSSGSGSSGSSDSSGGMSTLPSQGSGTGANTNSICLMGEATDIASASDTLAKLDVQRPQVLIKVQIIEVSSTAGQELGVNWSFSDLILNESAPDSGIKFGKFTRQNMTFTGAISALLSKGAAKLLAEPNISVIDGESASILIGNRILFPKLIGYSQFGTPIYDKDEEKVGIYLQIAPRVTSANAVLLAVYPQVSLVTSFLKTQAGDYPQISTREARTTVSVRNGEPLVIGGLLRNDEIRNASKIPLLGDLPIIGALFRTTKVTKEYNELIITLTPTILSTDQ